MYHFERSLGRVWGRVWPRSIQLRGRVLATGFWVVPLKSYPKQVSSPSFYNRATSYLKALFSACRLCRTLKHAEPHMTWFLFWLGARKHTRNLPKLRNMLRECVCVCVCLCVCVSVCPYTCLIILSYMSRVCIAAGTCVCM